jgi:hypothetical protein
MTDAATIDAPKAETGKGLAAIAALPTEIFTAEKAAEIVADLRREILTIDRDVSTKKGREAIASMAAKIARTKTAADTFGKQLKAEYKAKVDGIDAIRRIFWDGLEALQKEFRAPLTEFEEAEKARVDGHEAALAAIAGLTALDGVPTTDAIADRLTIAQAVDTSTFQEFTARAEAAKADAVAKLEAMLKAAEQRDAERAELERLRREDEARRQREREDQIAAQARAEAEAKARQEAEEAERRAQAEQRRIEREAREAAERAAAEQRRAEQEKQDAEERAAAAERRAKEAAEQAERDRVAAEERAKREAEAAVERERQRVEQERREAEEAARRREQDREHRAKIHREIVAALKLFSIDEDTARAIVTAIAKGDMPHAVIVY